MGSTERQGRGGLGGGGSAQGYSPSVPPPTQAGSSRALRWCRCSSQECSWGCGAPSLPSTGKGCAWGRRGGSSTRPGHPAPGASGHPGTGVCLRHPLPRTQQREAEALAPRPRPAPHAGQLPPRKQQARPGEGAGAGPAAAEPTRGQLEGRPSPRPLCVSPRPTPSTSSRRRRPSCPACWRCCPARGGSRARRRLRRSTPPAACPAPTSPTSPTCS